MIKNKEILLKDIIKKSDGNIVSDMDGEKVLLSIKNGKYFNLGEVGGHIWELIGLSTSAELIVSGLMSEYDVERAECEAQVLSFLEHLLEEELIQKD